MFCTDVSNRLILKRYALCPHLQINCWFILSKCKLCECLFVGCWWTRTSKSCSTHSQFPGSQQLLPSLPVRLLPRSLFYVAALQLSPVQTLVFCLHAFRLRLCVTMKARCRAFIIYRHSTAQLVFSGLVHLWDGLRLY